ncbi:MAG: hypothetical protein A3G18_06045 [Rhodospirillales bacterium RIFCSPLOWO2_12_FULL_58_28]|nr:MAG: hypothetical protein A3H92_06050 [Rhodospirillales bacterium RIFCSPLOWO2_02_FULL_58_16]OHC77263.1 MAG: hypothetical protein A3G18_06045 [Rhodospirillales bacterium RIFCSPLOWO2_12_FULL_58_28]
MFSRTSNGAGKAASSSSAKAAAPSIISSDLRITGDLNSEGEIQVDGVIEGDIRSDVLLVGETATIKGDIFCDSVHIHGTVNGQIKARAVDLAKTAHVVGDILHEDLSIETGAFLEGMCKRIPMKKDDNENKINFIVKDSLKSLGAPVAGDAPKKAAGGV